MEKNFFAQIEFVVYIFCKHDKKTSFHDLMTMFYYAQKILKNFESKFEIHEKVPSISSRLTPEDWQPRAKTNIKMFNVSI